MAVAVCLFLTGHAGAQEVSIAEVRDYPEAGVLSAGSAECNEAWVPPVMTDGTVLEVASYRVGGEARLGLYAKSAGERAFELAFDRSLSEVEQTQRLSVQEVDLNADGQFELLIQIRAQHGSEYSLVGRTPSGRWVRILETSFALRSTVMALADDLEYGMVLRRESGAVFFQSRGEAYPELNCAIWRPAQDLWDFEQTGLACPPGNEDAGRIILWASLMHPSWREQRASMLEDGLHEAVEIENLFACLPD